MRQCALSLFTLVLLLLIPGCAPFPGFASSQLRWGTYHTRAADAVLLYGDVGDEVRLLNPVGAVVASAVLHAPEQAPCKATYVLPLPPPDLAAFGLGQMSWPVGYRVQTIVAGHWTDAVPLGGGCNAVE